MTEEFQTMFMSLLVTILTGAASLVSAYILLYLRKASSRLEAETAKISNEMERDLVQGALSDINELIYQTVYAAQTTIVEGLKNQSSDNKLTKEDAMIIASDVKTKVLDQLTDDVKQLVDKNIIDIDSYVKDRIEVELTRVKNDLK